MDEAAYDQPVWREDVSDSLFFVIDRCAVTRGSQTIVAVPMSTGPLTIFDKSALQCLSIDDAVLFGQLYRTTYTPLFFVETMADLEKEVAAGKTPEQVVGTNRRSELNGARQLSPRTYAVVNMLRPTGVAGT